MSSSFAKVMVHPDASETTHLRALCDRMLGCLNVQSEYEVARRCKPDLSPYTSAADLRLGKHVSMQQLLGKKLEKQCKMV